MKSRRLAFALFALLFSIALVSSQNVGVQLQPGVDNGQQVYNVKFFGVKGDGVTDDSAKIQALVNTVSAAGGGTIFFPRSTYLVKPSASTGIALASNITLKGEGETSIWKIPDATGDYKAWLNITSLTNVKVQGLKFDQNPTGNIVSGTVPNVTFGITNHNQLVVYGSANNIEISGCSFDPTDGANALVIYGDNVTVINNRFVFARGQSLTDYDNSAIYVTGQNKRFIGNYFFANVSDHARGASESHGGSAVISGNITDGYETLVNVTPNGTASGVPSDVSITGNTVQNGNVGIRLWPAVNAGQILKNITVTGNTINLSQITHNDAISSGIDIQYQSGATVTGTSNITINSNVIAFQPSDTRNIARGVNKTVTDGVTNTDTSLVSATAAFVSTDVGTTVTGTGIPGGTTIASVTNATTVVLSAPTTATATGVTFLMVLRPTPMQLADTWGIGIGGVSTMSNIQVCNNTIENAPIKGIHISRASNTLSNFRVCDNIITDAGGNTSANAIYRSAIFVEGIVSNGNIDDNLITDTGSPTASNSLYYHPSSASNVTYRRNQIVSTNPLGSNIDATKALDLGNYGLLTPTAVKTSDYTALPGDFVPVDVTVANRTITLPNAPVEGTVVGVKMVATASGHVVNLQLQGSDVFNVAGGSATGTLSIVNQGVRLQYKASSAIWYSTSTDLPLTGLDSRYIPSTAPTGVVVTYSVTGVSFTATGTTVIFTVPTGKTFVCTDGAAVLTTVTGYSSSTLSVWSIKNSGDNAMTSSSTPSSAWNVAGIANHSTAVTSGAYNTAASGTTVGIHVTTANTSTALVGTVFVTGILY